MYAPDKLWRQLFIEQLERRNPRLTELDLSKGGWLPSRAMMEELCRAAHLSSSLRSLNFRTVPVVSAYPCDLLCSSLAGLQHLTALDLGSTGITGEHALPFSLLLLFKMPALTSLSLAGNRLTEGCNDPVNVFKNIMISAAHAPCLRHLDLSATGITFPAERLLFWQFLRQLQTLKSPLVSLSICENALGDDACSELGTALAQLQHLQALHLQHCKLKGNHIAQLLSFMHHVTSLTALHLQHNRFDGIAAVPTLFRNTSLTDLCLPPPPPPPDFSQRENRTYLLAQHERALFLVESAAKLCSRNRASAAAALAERARLQDVHAFAKSIAIEAIASVFDDMISAREAEAAPASTADSTVSVIEAANDGDWLSSKWAVDARKKKEQAAAAAAAVATAAAQPSPGGDAASSSASLPPRPAFPALLQRMGMRAKLLKTSSATETESPALPAADSSSAAANSDPAPVQLNQQQVESLPATSQEQPAADASADADAPTASQHDAGGLSAPHTAAKSGGGWAKLQSKFLKQSSASDSSGPAAQTAATAIARIAHKSAAAGRATGESTSAASLAKTQGQDSYMIHGLVDRRHLNGAVVTVVDDASEAAPAQSETKLVQLADGSRIRLRARNLSLLERAAPPAPADSFGLRSGEFVNPETIAKQKAQSLIKNKLTSSMRSIEAAAADDVSVKRLLRCMSALSQAPLDEDKHTDFLDALSRASSWAIVEASVPAHVAAAFALPQRQLHMLLEYVLSASPRALVGVLQGWGSSATDMPIVPLACIRAAGPSFNAWFQLRPVWPRIAADEAQSAADFFCSSARAVQSLLSVDAEGSLFASHALCFYTTVVCEEAAAFSEHLSLLHQPSAPLPAFPPPQVDAARSDPLHAALSVIAHALSLLCASPKAFAALRQPHPKCLCPSPHANAALSARGVESVRGFKDVRWEKILWQLMLASVRALEFSGLHRLHRKLCADRAIVLSRCISRTMQLLRVSALGLADAHHRLASIHPLLSCGLRMAWSENHHVVAACCDISSQAIALASSLTPSLPYSAVVELLKVAAALAAAEPDQSELQRALERKIPSASRLMQAATDSIFYRAADSSSAGITCESQIDVHALDVQRHMAALSSSLASAPLRTSLLAPLSACSHSGHALRVAALSCLRVILHCHVAASADNAASLRSVYRWHAPCN